MTRNMHSPNIDSRSLRRAAPAIVALLIASPAALASAPTPVSEPSALGLLAAAVVAAVIGRRYFRNK